MASPVPVPEPEPVLREKKVYRIKHADLHNPHIERYEHHEHPPPSAAAVLADSLFSFPTCAGILLVCYGATMVIEARTEAAKVRRAMPPK